MLRFGSLRGPGSWWPSNARRRTITIAEGDPVAAGTVGVVDRTYSRPLDGRSGSIIIGGESTGLVFTTIHGPRIMAPSRNRIGDPPIALPSTVADQVGLAPAQGTVMDSLAAIPPGVR